MDFSESDQVSAEKARRRALFRQRRAAMTAVERVAASARICARLTTVIERRGSETVSAFWPLAGEPDLRPLLRALHASGVTVALPIVTSGPGEGPTLEHRAFEGDSALVAGRFGVMEPLATAQLVSPEAVQLALVPALAVDTAGVRLGYGGGFYDAFLATTSAFRVGVVFAPCVIDSLPAEPHDARMDAIVSDEGSDRQRPASRNTGDGPA